MEVSKIEQDKVLQIVKRRCRGSNKIWQSWVKDTSFERMKSFQADYESIDMANNLVHFRFMFGHNETDFLEILHYYLGTNSGVFHSNRRWIYNTFIEWGKKMGKSDRSVRTYVKNLREAGIIQIKKLCEFGGLQTNYYTIDYKRLKELLDIHIFGQIYDEDELPCEGENSAIFPGGLPNITIDTNTYKSNKSITENFSNLEEGNSQMVTFGESIQSNYVIKGPEPSAREENGSFSIVEYLKTFKVRLLALNRSTRCVDMYEIIYEVLGEKVSGLGYLTKVICQRLGGALTRKFGGDLEKFREYLNRIRLSKYIMSSKFILTIFTLLSFSFIDRVIGGDLGIAQEEVSKMTQNSTILSLTKEEKHTIKKDMEAKIDLLDEPVECKDARKSALNALGAPLYKSWLLDSVKFKLDDSRVVIEAPNAFVRDKLGHHPDFIALREIGIRIV